MEKKKKKKRGRRDEHEPERPYDESTAGRRVTGGALTVLELREGIIALGATPLQSSMGKAMIEQQLRRLEIKCHHDMCATAAGSGPAAAAAAASGGGALCCAHKTVMFVFIVA